MLHEISYGIIPLRFDGVWQVFLVQHKGSLHWSFPKGKPEPGETHLATASRELFEETRLEMDRRLREVPFKEEYSYQRNGKVWRKEVFYYLAKVRGVPILLPAEIVDGAWLGFDEAYTKLTHKNTQKILRDVENYCGESSF
ncbi:MAG: NUDIX domain-containing protein [Chlamydiota bacterium]